MMLYPVFGPEPGLRPRAHRLKRRLTSPCQEDIRGGGWGIPAEQNQGLREEGVQAECWPSVVRLSVICGGIQQISMWSIMGARFLIVRKGKYSGTCEPCWVDIALELEVEV